MKFYKITALAAASALLFSGCAATAAMDSLQVNTVAAQKSTLESTVEIAGVFAPINTENVSAKTPGIIQTIQVGVGDKVSAGDTVVQLDTKDLEIQLAQSKAAYNVIKDQAVVAKSNLDAAQVGAVAASQALNATKASISDQVKQAQHGLEAAQKTYDATVAQNQIQLEQAQQNLENAQKDYDRAKALFESSVISQANYENAQKALTAAQTALSLVQTAADTAKTASQSQLDAAQNTYNQVSGSAANSQIVAGESNVSSAQSKVDTAQKQYQASSSSALEQAQASIDSIQNNISNATITSHINGIVVSQALHEGELAPAGVSLMTIADVSALKLNGTISQELIPYVSVGQTVDVVADIYPDKVLKGTVTNLGPMATSTGSYFPIQIDIDNADNALMAGLSAHATLTVSKQGAIVVPRAAVVQNNGEDYVFVIEDNTAVKKNVLLGLKSADSVEILNGLTEGEAVAVTNVNTLFDQMTVSAQPQ